MEEAAVSFSPSFNFYSSNGFAEKPTKVPDGTNPLETWTNVDDDFEFAYLSSDYDVTADDIFREGKIRQNFPIFNRDDLLTRNDIHDQTDDKKTTELTLRLPLEKSAVDDDLDSVPDGTYCVWSPKVVEKSPSRCKKSNPTGTTASKQWKLRDLLLHRRSNSEGKEDSFVFLAPKKAEMQGTVETQDGKREREEGVVAVGSRSILRKESSVEARREEEVVSSVQESPCRVLPFVLKGILKGGALYGR